MTSPALLYRSLDTHGICGALTATAAAEAVTLAAPGITSRFMHAGQRVRPPGGWPARACRGFPRRAAAARECQMLDGALVLSAAGPVTSQLTNPKNVRPAANHSNLRAPPDGVPARRRTVVPRRSPW
jgi:hypothetical protein